MRGFSNLLVVWIKHAFRVRKQSRSAPGNGPGGIDLDLVQIIESNYLLEPFLRKNSGETAEPRAHRGGTDPLLTSKYSSMSSLESGRREDDPIEQRRPARRTASSMYKLS